MCTLRYRFPTDIHVLHIINPHTGTHIEHGLIDKTAQHKSHMRSPTQLNAMLNKWNTHLLHRGIHISTLCFKRERRSQIDTYLQENPISQLARSRFSIYKPNMFRYILIIHSTRRRLARKDKKSGKQ